MWAHIENFMEALNKKYYRVGSYENQYTKWTTLQQLRDQMVLEYTNNFHTLHKNFSIRDLE